MSTAAIFENLNEAQRTAVAHVDGPLLILAGPGSGKTRVVTHRIAHLLAQGIPGSSILALTFTNKAAGEMRSRLHRMVGDSSVWLGTFHGYCARFLRRYARMVGLPENYSIYDSDDSMRALKQALNAANVSLSHLSIEQIASNISNLKNKLISPDVLVQNAKTATDHVLAKAYPAYQTHLLRSGAVDFDDLLLHTATLLRNSPELRAQLDSHHRYILVDEYQDTNLAQYFIVRSLSVDFPNLNVTGDPDQSIYGWRGANLKNILDFEKDYPNVSVVRLEQNYRSTPEILFAADYLIQHNVRRKAKHLVPTRASGTPIRLCTYPTDQDEADHIVEQIRTAILDEGRSANDFAILYRTNAQSRLLEKALLRSRISYQLIGGFRFYHRQEIKDLLAYLRLVHNAADDVAFERVVNTPPRRLGDKSLDKVRELARSKGLPMIVALRTAIEFNLLSTPATKGAKEFIKLFDEMVTLSAGSVVDVLEHCLRETDYIKYLQDRKVDAADDSVQDNVNELLADARQADEQFGEENPLQMFLEQVSLLSDTDSYESSSDRVTLMTLHAAKGLEFPHVYIIAVEHDILPHRRSKDSPDQLEEERRLLFVGMTRAKDQLQLSLAMRRGFYRSEGCVPSAFLMELPRASMQIVDLTHRYDHYYSDDDELGVGYPSSRKRWNIRENADEDSDTISVSDDHASQVYQDDNTDELCQLPPEELATRLCQMRGKTNGLSSRGLQRASDILDSDELAQASWEQFRVGSNVTHPEYGTGTIVSASGRGPKRVVKIEFNDSGTRSFRVAQANLTLVG